jgi:mono/diheme cytochrome c family protein
MNRIIAGVVVLAALIAAAGIVLWAGLYNVAATEPHWGVTRAVLKFARDRSIDYHSRGIDAPISAEPNQIALGFDHFHTTCLLCHGAPGRSSEEFVAGLYPLPPYLPSGEVQKARTAPQLFWIVKYGIKMSGMPAFGIQHEDRDLWDIVAFVQKVPDLTPEAYEGLIQKHAHGSGGHAHP